MTRRVCAANDTDISVAVPRGLRHRGAVVDAHTLQRCEARHIEHGRTHARGDDDGLRGEFTAVGEHHSAIRIFAAQRNDLLSGEQRSAESSCLCGGALREVGPSDAGWKAEIVLDQ